MARTWRTDRVRSLGHLALGLAALASCSALSGCSSTRVSQTELRVQRAAMAPPAVRSSEFNINRTAASDGAGRALIMPPVSREGILAGVDGQ